MRPTITKCAHQYFLVRSRRAKFLTFGIVSFSFIANFYPVCPVPVNKVRFWIPFLALRNSNF
ncbi:MAG: hypothetical protein FD187_3144 [bacterium]|nr:MAG: hypothetical protein FD187_3144 [bacterium]